jgi:hypothetical protein
VLYSVLQPEHASYQRITSPGLIEFPGGLASHSALI